MELYLQLGHGMKSLSEELILGWGKGTVIISPVNMDQSKIVDFAKKIYKKNGQVLFDPQLFYPKEGHKKLQAYDYWPNMTNSITNTDTHLKTNHELLRINNGISTSQIILPGFEMNKENFGSRLEWLKKSVDYFKSKTNKGLLATLCLQSIPIRDSDAIERLVEALRVIPVEGYYIIPQPANNEYIVSDPNWVIGMMKLISCLKLTKRKVIVGYSNHQGLIYALAHADAIASGTFMNTRSFVPGKFKNPKDNDIKHKSVWYYLPDAFTEYKAALLDVAKQRGYLDTFRPQGEYKNPYSEMLFKGAQPSGTNYNESNSFKHYLYCLRLQCEILSRNNYDETCDTYEFMLNSAENKISELKKRGMSGQNRNFEPAIEANRIAMCANDEDYGFKLKLEWNNL